MTDRYKRAKIYKITNDIDNDFYVGSTCEPTLAKRMANIRNDSKKQEKTTPLLIKMRELGVEHFKIVLLELFPCTSMDELRAREHYWKSVSTQEPALVQIPLES